MKLMLGQTVYCVVEDFAPEFHYRIAKCKVESIPSQRYREYKLFEKREHKPLQVYWRERGHIHDTLAEAVDEAERESDRYESVWQRFTHEVLDRPWRKESNNDTIGEF